MPTTRAGTKSNAMEGKLTQSSASSINSKNSKRHSKDEPQAGQPAKKTKVAPKTSISGRKKATSKTKPDVQIAKETKPHLTTPDLEFDYNRSQLRDPRATPGREARPRYDEHDLENMGLTDSYKARFDIPEPLKLGEILPFQSQWDATFRKKSLSSPYYDCHHLYICHKKGPNGSPTYDEGGFQVDWKKVDKWTKPRAYNKNRIVNESRDYMDTEFEERQKMFEIFFDGGPEFDMDFWDWGFYMKDQLSKDLGIPYHQITSASFRNWQELGFEKQNAKTWWHEPNEEEKKRESKMRRGGGLRKDL
ncbi:hypothetical protein BT63DRAFT_44740 [Microthyrium microscopicum]|uniref:Uncharacterized protein n=1 Tax=Microthyrium microscopicum TaxID=703497 RepID=A0A6A6U2W6_9PEZI|nr:hypothetical protein BT63DRAFT_44740 [Microthyrium microscopicum]